MKTAFIDQPCSRCGSKKIVARTWLEKVPTYSGKSTEVEYSQIVCTNKVCQKEFEENLAKETQKRKVIQDERKAKEELRKKDALEKADEYLRAKMQ